MQFIIRKKMGMRHRINSILAYLPTTSQNPHQLTIRWGEADLLGAIGSNQDVPRVHFERLISDFVRECGSNPVSVLALENGGDPSVWKLLKFAHRLDCPTKVVITGEGIDQQQAKELIYCGVDEICLIFGGLSSQVHRQVTGRDIDETNQVLRWLLQEKGKRNIKISIEMPWVGDVPREFPAVCDWANELGVDEVRAQIPYYGQQLSDVPLPEQSKLRVLLQRMLNNDNVSDAEPGWKRKTRIPCPIGKTRLEVSRSGRACSCPFKMPEQWNQEEFSELWKRLSRHRQQVRQCSRVCWHSELQYVRLS